MTLKELAVKAYIACGGLYWGGLLLRKRTIILVYHEIAPELLEEHLTYLKAQFGVTSLRQLANYYKGLASFPAGRVIITFDDGWRSNYELLPVIKRHSASVTIFLLAGMVGTNRQIWNYPLREVRPDLNNQFKSLQHKERLERLNAIADYTPEKEYSERVFLSLNEVEAMRNIVDFQSHGSFHPVLNTCTQNQVREDLGSARIKLEEITGNEINCVAYPYGRGRVGYTEANIAEKLGYVIGRVANLPRLVANDDDPMFLASLNVSNHATVRDLKRVIAWGQISTLMGRGRDKSQCAQ